MKRSHDAFVPFTCSYAEALNPPKDDEDDEEDDEELRDMFVHVTNATNTENVKTVWLASKAIILSNKLKATNIE